MRCSEVFHDNAEVGLGRLHVLCLLYIWNILSNSDGSGKSCGKDVLKNYYILEQC